MSRSKVVIVVAATTIVAALTGASVAAALAPSGLQQLPDPNECVWGGSVGEPDCNPVTGFEFPDLPPPPELDTGSPGEGVVSPDGLSVYFPVVSIIQPGAVPTSSILAFDRSTAPGPDFGKLTQLPGAGACLARDSDGNALNLPDATGCGSINTVAAHAGAIGQILQLAISPDGENVYATSRDGDAVLTFNRATAPGPGFGMLSYVGCVSHGGMNGCQMGSGPRGPRSVAVSADGRNVYVAGDASVGGSGSLVTYERNLVSGALTFVQCKVENGLPFAAGCVAGERGISNASSIAISPDDKTVYVGSYGSDAVAAFTRDLTANTPFGELSQIAGATGCISQTGLDHPGGTATCTDGSGLTDIFDIAVSPDGENVYAAGLITDSIAILDRDTDPAHLGELSQSAGAGGCVSDDADGAGGNPPTEPVCAGVRSLNSASGVAVSPDGLSVYTAAGSSNAIGIYDRAATGALTQLAGADGCIDPSSVVSTCADGVAIFNIDRVWLSPDGRSLYTAAFLDRAVGEYSRPPVVPDTPPPPMPTTPTPPALPPTPVSPPCKGKTATIVGTEGSDTLRGTTAGDVVAALGGSDKVKAGRGNDVVCGSAGRDRLSGGTGKDKLIGAGGKDKLVGGGGRDICSGGPGRDSASACERAKSAS